MKKPIAFLLASLLVIFAFVGCDSGIDLDDIKNAIDKNDVAFEDIEIQEQAVYDENDIKVIAKSLDFSDTSYVMLNFEVQNNSANDVRVYTNYFEINELYFAKHAFEYEYCECKAGETAETRAKMSRSTLEMSYIELIKDIDFSLCIENGHFETTGDGTYFVTDGFVTESTDKITLSTNCPADYEQEVDKEGTVLVDEEGIYLVLKDFYISDRGYPTVVAYCDNGYTEAIRARIYITEVNGIEYEDDGRLNMLDGHDGFPGFILLSSLDEKIGITEIENAKVYCKVYYGDTANSTLLLETEPVTIEF